MLTFLHKHHYELNFSTTVSVIGIFEKIDRKARQPIVVVSDSGVVSDSVTHVRAGIVPGHASAVLGGMG